VTLIEMCGPGKWLCRCDCGNEMRIHSGGLPGTKSCGIGPCNALWTSTPGYLTAHNRVRRSRGKATAQTCACGAPARAWAYDHLDPDEFLDPETGSPYSGDPSHYVSLCGPCHREQDNAERRSLRVRIKELEREVRAVQHPARLRTGQQQHRGNGPARE